MPAIVKNYVETITVDQVIDALKAFIQPFLPPNAQIVRGQINRVPLPSAPCVVLTELFEKGLDVPFATPIAANQTTTLHNSTQIDVQVDFYGEFSGNFAKAFLSAFRSEYGYGKFPDNVKPLYVNDGHKMPLTTGEEQYLSRWTLTASLQYNPTVQVPQQSATALKAKIYAPPP